MFSARIVHVIRLDASPAVERMVERITAPAGAFTARMEEVMAKARELLDALKKGVEETEANRLEAERLRKERDEYLAAEAEEDRLEAEEDETHAQAVAEYESSRAADRARIAELEEAIQGGLVLSQDEQLELVALIGRLTANPTDPPTE